MDKTALSLLGSSPTILTENKKHLKLQNPDIVPNELENFRHFNCTSAVVLSILRFSGVLSEKAVLSFLFLLNPCVDFIEFCFDYILRFETKFSFCPFCPYHTKGNIRNACSFVPYILNRTYMNYIQMPTDFNQSMLCFCFSSTLQVEENGMKL